MSYLAVGISILLITMAFEKLNKKKKVKYAVFEGAVYTVYIYKINITKVN